MQLCTAWPNSPCRRGSNKADLLPVWNTDSKIKMIVSGRDYRPLICHFDPETHRWALRALLAYYQTPFRLESQP